jgi:hypothetical protein
MTPFEPPAETEETQLSRRRFLTTSAAMVAGTLASDFATATPAEQSRAKADEALPVTSGRSVHSMNGLEIEICERTGGLTRLSYGSVGTLLEASEEDAGILTVGYPVKEFVPLMLEPRLSRARVLREDGGLTLIWDQLSANRSGLELPPGRVSSTVQIRPAPDGRSIILRARVENHSQGEVTQILFPDLRGLRPIDEPQLMELRMALGVVNPLAGPVTSPGRSPFYAPTLWQEYPSEGQYHRNALRWMDYGSLKGGFGLFEKMWMTEPRPSILTHRNEASPTDLRVVWQHKIQVKANETWESAEYWLTPHAGGWAKGIEVFRDYVTRVKPPRPVATPDRIRNGLGFQTVWMIQSAECDAAYAAFRFTDLGRIARDAKAHGIDELVLWGWCHYGTLPIRAREELGTPEELLAGIRRAAEAGVNVSLFVSIKQLDDRFAPRYGVPPGTSASWTFHPELIPAMFSFDAPSKRIDVDTRNEVWQRDVFDSLSEWVERGVTSFAWDVFDDAGSMGLINLIQRVREQVRQQASGSFAGEPYLGTHERAAQVLDYTWCWNDYLDAGAYSAVLRSPRINTNVESSARVVKMAFADGLYINAMPKRANQPNGTKLISEEPELAAALREVAPLRLRYLEYFTAGTYLGDSFLVRPAAQFVRKQRASLIGGATDIVEEFEYPSIFVRGYQNARRLLIIVLNNDAVPRKVDLESDLTLWLPGADACRVSHYDSHGVRLDSSSWRAGTHWVGTIGELRPLQLAFLELVAD